MQACGLTKLSGYCTRPWSFLFCLVQKSCSCTHKVSPVLFCLQGQTVLPSRLQNCNRNTWFLNIRKQSCSVVKTWKELKKKLFEYLWAQLCSVPVWIYYLACLARKMLSIQNAGTMTQHPSCLPWGVTKQDLECCTYKNMLSQPDFKVYTDTVQAISYRRGSIPQMWSTCLPKLFGSGCLQWHFFLQTRLQFSSAFAGA